MSRPCGCDRTDPSPWAAYRPGDCRLCWLYHHDPEYRSRWDDGEDDKVTRRQGDTDLVTLSPGQLVKRSLPCIHLGEVLDEKGCPCPGLWVRACGLHGPITIQTCKTCPDYEEDA